MKVTTARSDHLSWLIITDGKEAGTFGLLMMAVLQLGALLGVVFPENDLLRMN